MNSQAVPDCVRQALERLREPPIDAPQEGPDLRWAHRIMERWRRGEKIKSATLQMAREALGIKAP